MTNTLLFPQNSSRLDPRQLSEIDAVAASWNAVKGSARVRVDGYASPEGKCDDNWRLSCRRAESVARELAHPTNLSPGVPAASIDQFAHGESNEGSQTALAPNRMATISIPQPLPPPKPVQDPKPERVPEPEGEPGNKPGCIPAKGIPPTECDAYNKNSWWLPDAYVQNATCACQVTPDTPSANRVRGFLQDRLAATPAEVVADAMWAKDWAKDMEWISPLVYEAWVIENLTPRIEQDHIDAYKAGCCPSGPAPSYAWVGVTTVPLPCSAVDLAIRQFGSCHGTPGKW